MKHFIFLALIISNTAFAIDFNKVTGTFSDVEKEVATEESTDLAYGSFEPKETNLRAPASVTEEVKKADSVNDITGTFEYQND